MNILVRSRFWICALTLVFGCYMTYGQGSDSSIDCAVFLGRDFKMYLDLNRYQNLSQGEVTAFTDSDVIEVGKNTSIVCLLPSGVTSATWRKKDSTTENIPSNQECWRSSQAVSTLSVVQRNTSSDRMNSTLVICSANRSNAGVYIITAGSLMRSIPIYTKPEISTKFESVSKYKGGDVTFKCNGSGDPSPNYFWYFDNNLLTNNSRNGRLQISSDIKQLSIQDLQYSDRGNYSCRLNSSRPATNSSAALAIGFTAEKGSFLRVRDPLGVLWPCLGIIGQAIALALILFADSKYGKKRKGKFSRNDSQRGASWRSTATATSETGLLQNDEVAFVKPSSGTARFSKSESKADSSGARPLVAGDSPNLDDLRYRTVSV